MLKQLFIPVAAFAVTATSAAAFGGAMDWSNLDIDLSNTEQAALEEAQEIRQSAHEEAQSVLEAAGIDDERMKEIQEAMHEVRHAGQEAMKTALEAGDYDAFLSAVADTPLADVIQSEEDFAKFLSAHELREAGDHEAAAEIMAELGLERPEGGEGRPEHTGDRGEKNGLGGPGHFGDRPSAETE